MAKGNPFEVFRAFLVLGLTAFGGPVAHLGYFRREFVEKRAWLTAEDYATLIALCQFLPGPASSQTGFCIGLKRAGWLGGLAAWLGFTLPSALLMYAMAHWLSQFQSWPMAQGILHGLQLAAIAVVAQAVWTMARTLCPDTPRRALGLLATALLAIMPGTGGQIFVLIVGALIGILALESPPAPAPPRPAAAVAHAPALLLLALFALLLLATFFLPQTGALGLFAAFYRSGALVFGGGHVVLPLLREAIVIPGWVSPQLFLSGYGAAQAVPGPLFTVAAFLGAVASGGPQGAFGAAIATLAIFLPGLLLVSGALPYWQALQRHPSIAAAVKGLNAAVVGLLGATFIGLLNLGTLVGPWDLPIAITAILLLSFGRARPILVVLFCAAAGALA
jgi:chromate transporter